jgi:hypothetical protein
MQTAPGLRDTTTGITKELILKELGRVKWFLWHGNVVRADDTLSSLIDDVDGVRGDDRGAGRPRQLVLKKASRALEEFGTYIDNNAGAIVNYGERRRYGARISTGFVESTINQLTSLVVPLRPSGGGPQPVHEERATANSRPPPISYLAFALAAAAAVAVGSAKAITASPSVKLKPGLPPKP